MEKLPPPAIVEALYLRPGKTYLMKVRKDRVSQEDVAAIFEYFAQFKIHLAVAWLDDVNDIIIDKSN